MFLTVFFIFVVTPLPGVATYAMLLRKMVAARIDSPPTVPFSVLFFTLGGWVLVLLTAWLWEWSGLASLGMIYLLLVAPVLTGVMPWKLRSQRTLSTRAPTLKGFVSPAPMERIISPGESDIGKFNFSRRQGFGFVGRALYARSKRLRVKS